MMNDKIVAEIQKSYDDVVEEMTDDGVTQIYIDHVGYLLKMTKTLSFLVDAKIGPSREFLDDMKKSSERIRVLEGQIQNPTTEAAYEYLAARVESLRKQNDELQAELAVMIGYLDQGGVLAYRRRSEIGQWS